LNLGTRRNQHAVRAKLADHGPMRVAGRPATHVCVGGKNRAERSGSASDRPMTSASGIPIRSGA
jgi:hypothetical protein